MWHKKAISFWLLLLAMLSVAANAASTVKKVELEAVTVHLFLEGSGELTPDITSIQDFIAWNFKPMGNGISDGERFHSFLIKLAFYATTETFEPGVVAEVRVVNKKNGKIILSRTIRGLYVGPSQFSYVPIFVNGHECEKLTVQVSSPAKSISKELPFSCGE